MAIQQPTAAQRVTLSPAQIASWAQGAGFSGQDLTIAIAVALAESSGRTDATNSNANGSTDYGVWQINDQAHPDLFTQYPQWWSVQNAQMAHAVFASSGWGAWTVYTSGKYMQFMGQAGQAAANPDTSNVTGGPGSVTTESALEGIGNSFSLFATGVTGVVKWITDPHNLYRIAMALVGGALVIGALVVTAGNTALGVVGRRVAAPLKQALSTKG